MIILVKVSWDSRGHTDENKQDLDNKGKEIRVSSNQRQLASPYLA